VSLPWLPEPISQITDTQEHKGTQTVGMGLQQGPFDWVPQQGRAELDPYNNTKRNIPNNSHCIRDVSFSVIVRIEFRAPLLGDPIEGSLLHVYTKNNLDLEALGQ
jgi:hypothetical protein